MLSASEHQPRRNPSPTFVGAARSETLAQGLALGQIPPDPLADMRGRPSNDAAGARCQWIVG